VGQILVKILRGRLRGPNAAERGHDVGVGVHPHQVVQIGCAHPRKEKPRRAKFVKIGHSVSLLSNAAFIVRFLSGTAMAVAGPKARSLAPKALSCQWLLIFPKIPSALAYRLLCVLTHTQHDFLIVCDFLMRLSWQRGAPGKVHEHPPVDLIFLASQNPAFALSAI
jgi:hypothetical protein